MLKEHNRYLRRRRRLLTQHMFKVLFTNSSYFVTKRLYTYVDSSTVGIKSNPRGHVAKRRPSRSRRLVSPSHSFIGLYIVMSQSSDVVYRILLVLLYIPSFTAATYRTWDEMLLLRSTNAAWTPLEQARRRQHPRDQVSSFPCRSFILRDLI